MGGVLVDAKGFADVDWVRRAAEAVFVEVPVQPDFFPLHQCRLFVFVHADVPCLVLAEGDTGSSPWVHGVPGVMRSWLCGGLVVYEHFGVAVWRYAKNDAAVVPGIERILVGGPVRVQAFYINDVAHAWAAGNPVTLALHESQYAFDEPGGSFVVSSIL